MENFTPLYTITYAISSGKDNYYTLVTLQKESCFSIELQKHGISLGEPKITVFLLFLNYKGYIKVYAISEELYAKWTCPL